MTEPRDHYFVTAGGCDRQSNGRTDGQTNIAIESKEQAGAMNVHGCVSCAQLDMRSRRGRDREQHGNDMHATHSVSPSHTAPTLLISACISTLYRLQFPIRKSGLHGNHRLDKDSIEL